MSGRASVKRLLDSCPLYEVSFLTIAFAAFDLGT